ncbi:glycerophosphodiester phosphodiesterase [Flavobacterium orientale]|uniref:Glycerophosphoryl diester phosphodiesterase n=1 Tax=Flavobacterium orientale TaxID=1756020 RepID=A0A916XXM2_9FLAO|nr:glycerophosphodiester phosphodiesterase [Flavobacterium orientale]GGD19756.1 glycerophosphoryl diester phosphodiesterase [Flavobacterium orientale]
MKPNCYLLLILALTFINCSKMKKPLNIGHRGAMGHETENTIASVKKALELHVDMIEIDVFLIKGGELVVFHDEILDSLTNTSGRIEEFTFEELQKVIVKGNHHIPTLEEVIETIDRKAPLNIELKGKNTATPTFKLLEKCYQKGWKKDDFVISSFLWEELEAFRKLDDKISIAILTEENPIAAISIGKKLKAVAINPWWKTLTKENVHQIHNEGFKIYTYTVNEPSDIKFVTELGVDGIFCNFPERLH